MKVRHIKRRLFGFIGCPNNPNPAHCPLRWRLLGHRAIATK